MTIFIFEFVMMIMCKNVLLIDAVNDVKMGEGWRGRIGVAGGVVDNLYHAYT